MFTKTRILILTLTLICFLVWITADLIKTPATFTPDSSTTEALQPLNPTFDTNTLELVSKSNPSLPPFSSKTPLKPSPTPKPVKSASPSANLNL